MKKTIIISVSALVFIGAGTLLVRHYLKKKKNDKDTDSSKTDGSSTDGSRGGDSDSGIDTSTMSISKIKGDAEKIYSALNLWTTDKDEMIIVEIIGNYSPSSFKKLEKLFNQDYQYKIGDRIKNDRLKDWLEEDLSEENFDKIRSILG